jgi:3-deoxy-D-manno-octulosonic-acid transferase
MFLYNLLLKSYQFSLKLASPFHTKAEKMLAGRKRIFEQILLDTTNRTQQNKNYTTDNQQLTAWFHCASLGEFEQGRTLIEAFRKKYPNYTIVLSFFSPSGYEIRKNYEYADTVYYLPFDSQANAIKWFDLIKPTLILFVKYEFWYYYLHEAKKRNITTISFSAIFRKEQLFFKPYGNFYRNILHCFSHIFVQNKTSYDLLQSIGLQQVSIAGDTRFDRVIEIAASHKTFPIIENFKQQNFLLVVGSSWADDIEVLSDFIKLFPQKLKIVIAPHEISEKNLQHIENKIGINSSENNYHVIRYSKTDAENASLGDILLIDNIGMLSSLYAYADVAFIGGAYGDGLHNILEAAVFGVPILFGNKKYKNFQEAVDLLALGGAFSVANSEELMIQFLQLYDNQAIRKNTGKICYDYTQANQGGTKKILEFLALYIK